jgi:hypothetical protein
MRLQFVPAAGVGLIAVREMPLAVRALPKWALRMLGHRSVLPLLVSQCALLSDCGFFARVSTKSQDQSANEGSPSWDVAACVG